MRQRACLFRVVLACALGCFGPARAAAKEPAPCPAAVLDAVAVAALHRSADEQQDYRAGVCKRQPQAPGILLVGVALSAEEESAPGAAEALDKVDLAVAVVDAASQRVLAFHSWQVEEDADFRVDAGSLKLDTANYWLDDRTLAFGLDVTSGYIAHCGQGGLGPRRTLFVREGAALRPVLADVPLSRWEYLVEPSGRCNWAAKRIRGITARRELSLAVGRDTQNGFRHLVVTLRSFRDDGRALANEMQRLELRYDGRGYPDQPVRDAMLRDFVPK